MLCWCSSDGCKCWLWSDRLFPFALKHSSTKQREHLQHACFWNHCIFYVPLMATLYYIFFRIVLTVFPGIFEAHYFFYFFCFKTAVHFPAKDKLSFLSLSFCQGPLEIILSWKFCLLWSDTSCLKDSGRTSTFYFLIQNSPVSHYPLLEIHVCLFVWWIPFSSNMTCDNKAMSLWML